MYHVQVASSVQEYKLESAYTASISFISCITHCLIISHIDRANLDDVVCNADLYIANQEDFTQGAISQS